MSMMLIQNQVLCKKCGDEPFSGSVHDFSACKCGAIAVDGGLEYLRRVGDFKNCEEMSISLPEDAVKAAIAEMKEAEGSGRNMFGVFCAAMRALRKNGVRFDVSDAG